MKIAVLAADGRSGQAFVSAALAAGHQIRAGVMHLQSHHLPSHSSLEVVQCDATQSDQVRALLSGQQAVASFIGHVKGSAATVQEQAMEVIVQAMNAQGLRRIVSLTGTGVRFPGDRISLIDRLLNMSISIIDPARVADGRAHVRVLQASGLDWTVIRVLKLQNVSPKPFALREHGPTKVYVGRQEVAEAVLQVLEERSFIGKAPIIGKPDNLSDLTGSRHRL